MQLDRLFRPRPARAAGHALYVSAVAQSRLPTLYAELGAPDTVEGRFEVYSLHVILLLDRMRGHGQLATDVSQVLFDTFVSGLDNALREMGVGDLSVGRKMRKLGEAFYGRCKSYETAFASLPDREALDALIVRTVYADADATLAASLAPKMAAYVVSQRVFLVEQALERILSGAAAWA